MLDEEYKATQNQLLLAAGIISTLDLDGFLKRIREADALGPILDPTLYRKGMCKMQQIADIARAAQAIKGQYMKLADL